MVRIPDGFRPAAKAARKAGWTIRVTGGGHLAWTAPGGGTVYTPSTPSDWRGVKNKLAVLRRAGLPV